MLKADINEEQMINSNNRMPSSATILSDYQLSPVDVDDEAVNSRSDLHKLSQATMVEAQQIEFFGGKGDSGEVHLECSPESPLLGDMVVNDTNELLMAASQHLDGFALEEDDAKSFDEEVVDQEEEERAVAEFVTEIELQHKSGIQLRATDGANEDVNDNEDNGSVYENEDKAKGKEDDEMSQQFSIDDVTDDEEGEPPPSGE